MFIKSNESALFSALTSVCTITQGRSQKLEMGGAKLLGEGFGGRLRPKGGAHAP